MQIRVFRGTGGSLPPNSTRNLRRHRHAPLHWRNILLGFVVAIIAVIVGSMVLGVSPVTPDTAAELQKGSVTITDAPGPEPGDTYIETCRGNGVPIPPDWPDEKWIPRGELPFVFAAFPDARTNEVFTYEDPDGKGICYALVRKNHNKYYEAVGIICQGKKTGKACFWDNVIPGPRVDARIRGLEIKLEIRKIGNGSNMRQNCTECHRGAKVFLIHPDTPLAAIQSTKPDVRYSPIGQINWDNPLPMEHKGNGSCTQCHELPTPTKHYCGLLRQAAEKTMPSRKNPAGWDSPRPEFKDAIERIKARCAEFG